MLRILCSARDQQPAYYGATELRTHKECSKKEEGSRTPLGLIVAWKEEEVLSKYEDGIILISLLFLVGPKKLGR